MQFLDSEIESARALVVDGKFASRASLVAMLRSAGVSRVEQVGRLADARRLLETHAFDIVLCEYHFDDEAGTGLDLLADLRLAQVLPLGTVVVMISGEAAYEHVAEAAEAALDAYLIKPHNEEALHQRLRDARRRKRALAGILESVSQRRFAVAVDQCESRVATRGPAWVHAARIGAELHVRLGQPTAARRLLDAVVATRALPWARLGIARAHYQAGSLTQARRTLETLLTDQPGFADAYDVMGRVLLEQGDVAGALDTLRRACVLTPGSITRLQKFGVLAFYHGDPIEAAEMLQRATTAGLNSKVFDLQGLVLQAALQYDTRQAKALSATLATLARRRRENPDSARVAGLAEVVEGLHLLAQRQAPEAILLCQRLLARVMEPKFDFEAACNVLILLSRIYADEARLGDIGRWLEALARRFAVSKASTELMVCAARHVPALEEALRAGHAYVFTMAEEAVGRSIAGERGAAVRELIDQAEVTRNAKLLDLADHTLQLHVAEVADHAYLRQRIDTLRASHHHYGTQIHLTKLDAAGPGGDQDV